MVSAITSTECYAFTMVRFALIVLVAGCVGSTSHTPAWPKQHQSETDGGESLAPHVAGATAIAASSSDDDKPIIPVVVAPTTTIPTVTPPVTPTVTTPVDETIQTEEIIIEIDD
jgi:hypothetical protein